MSIDERELRSRLAETAAQAGPPRFTAGSLAAQVRRIRTRRRRAGIATAACAVAVLAVAIPVAWHGSRSSGNESVPPAPRQRPGSGSHPGGVEGVPAPQPSRLSYSVTADGQVQADGRVTGTTPLFTITPGKRMTITVEVTLPRRPATTALWLGIVDGTLSARANMDPVLAYSGRAALRPGTHRFVLYWLVPAGLKPGSSRQLASAWAWSGPHAGQAETQIADFAVPLPPAALTGSAVAHRLRAAVLHDVANCGGTKPAWIRAVRTTFGKASAYPDVSQGVSVTDSGADPVFLVLMKGYFILHEGGPLPNAFAAVCAHMAGHYLLALFDGRTLVNLGTGLGSRPFRVPLQSLGPVQNLAG